MGITIRNGIPTRCFSKNIPNLTVGIGGDRLEVGIRVNNAHVYSETLFPVNAMITLSELGNLLTSYVRRPLVAQCHITMEEYKDGSATDRSSIDFTLVYCEADVPTSCDDFCHNHFLSLLIGTKITAVGRLEYLHYVGNDAANVTAYYTDGSTQSYGVTPMGSNPTFTTIDVSPKGYVQPGKSLRGYVVTAGARRQSFIIDATCPDASPILLFVNSFGCDELLYCTGTLKKSPTFKRKSAVIDGVNKNYSIVETRQFKADTGILNEDMADWFGDVLRSPLVRVVTLRGGSVTVGREVIITDSKTEQTNRAEEMPRFTFTYQYAQRNHNVVELDRTGRVFDHTFDYTFE